MAILANEKSNFAPEHKIQQIYTIYK